VERWKDGDWWEVQVEHVTYHAGIPEAGWTPGFRYRFSVTRSEGEVRVEVSTVPENRFRERLVLRYKPTGELIGAQVVDPERVEELGPAGGFGAFGMLGREAFDVSRAPSRAASSKGPVRVALSEGGGTAQTWGGDDPWWSLYETPEGVPMRGQLTGASWRKPATGSDTVVGSDQAVSEIDRPKGTPSVVVTPGDGVGVPVAPPGGAGGGDVGVSPSDGVEFVPVPNGEPVNGGAKPEVEAADEAEGPLPDDIVDA
jgi:hypothetical protein